MTQAVLTEKERELYLALIKLQESHDDLQDFTKHLAKEFEKLELDNMRLKDLVDQLNSEQLALLERK